MKHIKKIIKFTLFFSIAFLYGVECSHGERVILDSILESRFVALDDSKKEQLKGYVISESLNPSVDVLYTIDKPLFEKYPALQQSLVCLDLGTVSTFAPVRKLSNLGDKLGATQLFMKDDGFGDANTVTGNKRRKLEFILADAVKNGAQHVVTFGCIGSNHAAQTAHFAHNLGLKCTLHLTPQPLSHGVRNNLLINQDSGADIYVHKNWSEIKEAAFRTCIECKEKTGIFPYIIPVGGSNPLGSVGYVNAAFELKKQIDAQLMPMPHYIYCPIGSRGTAAGLVVGLRAAGITAKVVLIEIDEDDTKERYLIIAHATNQMLKIIDSSFPLIDPEKDVVFERGFSGYISGKYEEVYGLYTKEGMEAKKLFAEYENVKLDGCYTAKAASGLIYDIRNKPELKDKVILYWNTFGIHKTATRKNQILELQSFFEGDVQELDQ